MDDISNLEIGLEVKDGYLTVTLYRRTDTGWKEHISSDYVVLSDILSEEELKSD
jgi:hypothetical protein